MRATAEVSKAAANLDDPTPHTQGSVLYLPSIKRAASSVALVSNEVGPLPSCQLVSLKLPYIHTSLPLPFTILQNTTYVTLELEKKSSSNRRPTYLRMGI